MSMMNVSCFICISANYDQKHLENSKIGLDFFSSKREGTLSYGAPKISLMLKLLNFTYFHINCDL